VQWLFGVIVVIVLAAMFSDVFARGRRGTSLAFGVAAGIAALVAGITQAAEVERPWPLLVLLASVALAAQALRSERPLPV
jgi:uncharacterized membrane protein